MQGLSFHLELPFIVRRSASALIKLMVQIRGLSKVNHLAGHTNKALVENRACRSDDFIKMHCHHLQVYCRIFPVCLKAFNGVTVNNVNNFDLINV